MRAKISQKTKILERIICALPSLTDETLVKVKLDSAKMDEILRKEEL